MSNKQCPPRGGHCTGGTFTAAPSPPFPPSPHRSAAAGAGCRKSVRPARRAAAGQPFSSPSPGGRGRKGCWGARRRAGGDGAGGSGEAGSGAFMAGSGGRGGGSVGEARSATASTDSGRRCGRAPSSALLRRSVGGRRGGCAGGAKATRPEVASLVWLAAPWRCGPATTRRGGQWRHGGAAGFARPPMSRSYLLAAPWGWRRRAASSGWRPGGGWLRWCSIFGAACCSFGGGGCRRSCAAAMRS